jgi:hypothetical protein
MIARRSFLKLAAVAVVVPALNWTPVRAALPKFRNEIAVEIDESHQEHMVSMEP